MYKSPHSLTAKNRLFWKRRKKKRIKREKKDWTYKCLCLTGCRRFRLLTSLCVQATIHCKDQAKWTCCVFCFSFRFFSCPFVLRQEVWILKPQIVKRKRFRWEGWTNGWSQGTEQEEEQGDSYWNCQQNELSIQMSWPLWHQNSVTKQSMPVVRKTGLL